MKRILIVLAAIVLSFSLAACGGASFTAGSYDAGAAGFGGDVKVSITVDKSKITDVSIDASSETASVGQAAVRDLKAQILDKQSTEIDGVSGATFTTDAVKEATDKALAEARGDVIAAGTVEDGKYVTEGLGHEGIIHVATEFRNGDIFKVEVLTHDETIGIGTFAIEADDPQFVPYAAQIAQANSLAVDAISGATFTCKGIRDAVSDAIVKAGGSPDDFKTPVEKVMSTEAVTEDVDIVVMGAGTAGLVAATRLAEKGYNVLVFEKKAIPGGAMAMTYSGVLSTQSKMQNAWNNGKGRTAEQLAGYWASKVDPALATNGEGAPYFSHLLDVSGDFVDWIQGIGVGFNTIGLRSHGDSPYFAPGSYRGGAGYVVEYLAQHCDKIGGRIIYSTPVTELKTDANGKITGVKAVAENGKTWDVNADVVLLTSGGFAANQEMLEEYYPQYAQYTFNCPAGSTGDGILMGREAGAGIETMGRTVTAFLSTYDTKYELAFIHYTTPGIIVNINGDSIGNILHDNHGMLSAAKADPANGDTFYYVFDEASRWQTKRSITKGLPYGVSYEPIFEKGEAVKYKDLETAAAELELPGLVASVENNNKHYLNGEDDEFGREAHRLPYIDTKSGVYLMRVEPTWYLTTGGLSADLDGRILDENRNPIPNLYGAGDVLGSIEEKDGTGYAFGFDAAMMYGYIAAEAIEADGN